MRKSLLAMLVLGLILASPALAETPLSPRWERFECPAYGCEARIIPLCGGDYVLQGELLFPMTWYAKEPPVTEVKVLRGYDQVLQTIPVRWAIRDYTCCCPSEWAGDYAEVLRAPVKPGEWLRVLAGDVCTVYVQIPNYGGDDQPIRHRICLQPDGPTPSPLDCEP